MANFCNAILLTFLLLLLLLPFLCLILYGLTWI